MAHKNHNYEEIIEQSEKSFGELRNRIIAVINEINERIEYLFYRNGRWREYNLADIMKFNNDLHDLQMSVFDIFKEIPSYNHIYTKYNKKYNDVDWDLYEDNRWTDTVFEIKRLYNDILNFVKQAIKMRNRIQNAEHHIKKFNQKNYKGDIEIIGEEVHV